MNKEKSLIGVQIGILIISVVSIVAVILAIRIGRDIERNLARLEKPVSTPASAKATKVVVHGPDELTEEFKFEGRTYVAVRIKLRPSVEAGKIDHNALQLRAQACLDLCLWDFQQAVVKGDVYVALFRLISNDEQKWVDEVMAEATASFGTVIANPLTTQPGK